MISGNVPNHLIVGARTGFLTSLSSVGANMPWQRVAMQVPMTAKSLDLVDLGGAPMPTDSATGATLQDFIEKVKTVKPIDWNITVSLSYNAMNDDQTGNLERRVRAAGLNFQKHINKRVFQTLNGGDGSTYGLCYDGQNMISASHADKGAAYNTAQSNLNALALGIDNFETVWVAANQFVDDQGNYTEYNYDLIVTHPTNARAAYQITSVTTDASVTERAENPWAGKLSYITSPYMDTTAWHLVASGEPTKPLFLVMREQPNLQDAWFDPKAPDGGRFYFKFFARYNVEYGDWRLDVQGRS